MKRGVKMSKHYILVEFNWAHNIQATTAVAWALLHMHILLCASTVRIIYLPVYKERAPHSAVHCLISSLSHLSGNRENVSLPSGLHRRVQMQGYNLHFRVPGKLTGEWNHIEWGRWTWPSISVTPPRMEKGFIIWKPFDHLPVNLVTSRIFCIKTFARN